MTLYRAVAEMESTLPYFTLLYRGFTHLIYGLVQTDPVLSKTDEGNHKMKKVMIIATSLLVGSIAINAWACGPGSHTKLHGHEFYDEMKHIVFAQVVGLTEEQKTEIESIRADVKGDFKKSYSQEKTKPLFQLSPGSDSFQEDMAKLAKVKAKKVEAHILAKAEVYKRVYDILTPEQREKFKVFREEMHKVTKHQKGDL